MRVPAQQVTTLTFFRFDSLFGRFWAFMAMGIAPFLLARAKGPVFYKLLGTGGSNGFGARPDFSTYALLFVWEDSATAARFFEHNGVWRAYQKRGQETHTFYLNNIMAHGWWSGQQPFVSAAPFDPAAPIAVITRATIRWSRLWSFWRNVAPVSRSMEGQPGLLFAKGIGELPWIQQATFSVWASGKQMTDYAYQSALHAQVIRTTREKGWYQEELFARFALITTKAADH